MSCTKEEIAEKRRIAMEKLKSKQIHAKAAQTEINPEKLFYGQINNNNSVHNVAQSSGNQIGKIVTNPLQKNRILSQPYPRKGPSAVDQKTNSNTQLAPVFKKTVNCVCSMISDNRFSVVVSGFHTQLINIFKTIPSKSYDSNTKNWSFSLDDYSLLQERTLPLNPDVILGKIPKFVRTLLSKPVSPIEFSYLTSLEPTIHEALMNFQKKGVCFGIEKQGRCMIADEMGLGKTYQALALADFYRDDWPLLICTTAATRDVWLSKINLLLPYVANHHIVCMTSNQDYFGDAKVLILSYSIMEKNYEKLLEKKFGFLIFDESHSLKNFKAKSTAAALKLARQSKRVVLLTGTPALSRPSELFSQLQMIDPKFFNYQEYTIRYCEGHQTTFGWNACGQSNLTELGIILNRKFMIRRTKQEVQLELAEKSREIVILDPNHLVFDEDTTENLKSYAEDFSKLKGRDREEVLLRFYSETAKAKTKAVTEYLKTLLKEKKKFIIFAHHQVMMNAISKFLEKRNVDFIRIDGSTRNEIRTAHISRFQTKNECNVALLSLKACNSGITLTAAQLVVFAELDWNPSTLAQAESRAHRIGQEGEVICRYLLAKGTADDAIWIMLQNKQNTLNKAGLFNENLSDNTPVSSDSYSNENKIDKYIIKEKPKNESIESTVSTISICNEVPTVQNSNKCDGLLDEDDEYFMDLNF